MAPGGLAMERDITALLVTATGTKAHDMDHISVATNAASLHARQRHDDSVYVHCVR